MLDGVLVMTETYSDHDYWEPSSGGSFYLFILGDGARRGTYTAFSDGWNLVVRMYPDRPLLTDHRVQVSGDADDVWSLSGGPDEIYAPD